MADIIWQMQETTARIGILSTPIFEAEYPTAALSIVTPLVANTHYKAELAGVPYFIDATPWLTVTVTEEYAQGCIISVENTSFFDIDLTYLAIEGTLITPGYSVTRSMEDATSIAAYGERTLDLRTKYALDLNDAIYMVAYALAFFKDPTPVVRMTVQGKDDTLLAQILDRIVSDRISVVNTKLGMNTDFFIEKMEHHITQGDIHSVIYTLGKVLGAKGVWILNTSELNNTTVLAY